MERTFLLKYSAPSTQTLLIQKLGLNITFFEILKIPQQSKTLKLIMQNIRIIGEVQLEFTIYTSIVYIYDNTAILNKCGHGDIILILQYIFMMWPIVVVLKSFALYLFVFGVDTFFFVVSFRMKIGLQQQMEKVMVSSRKR